MKRNAQGGFTLIEMMVVVVIITILATIAITTFGGMSSKAKIAATKGYIATLRSSTELYYSDFGGIFPYQTIALTDTDSDGNPCEYINTPTQKENNAWVPQYMSAWIPKLRLGRDAWGTAGTDSGHEGSTNLKIVGNSVTPHVNPAWPVELIYNRDNGEIWLNSDITDPDGILISEW